MRVHVCTCGCARLCVCVQCRLSWNLCLWFYSCSESPDFWPLRRLWVGSGQHHYSPGLLLPFLPQPPPSSQRVGWGSEEGADPGGGGRDEQRTKEALPPHPSPLHPLPRYQKASSSTSSTGKGPGSPVPGRGHTRARGRPCQGKGAHRALSSGSRAGRISSQAQNELAHGQTSK